MIKLVSVIVPIYCISKDYLKCCLNSLVHQTYQNIEIILVDDGSPDQSGEICDAYAEKYPIVKVIHQDNQGVSAARNNGMQAALGEYLMFVDADDWIDLDCIEIAVREIERHNVDLLLFQYCRESDKGREYLDSQTAKRYEGLDKERMQMMTIAGVGRATYVFKVSWGKLIRKSVVTENNILFPVNLKRAEDSVFNLYLYQYMSNAYYLEYVGYHYRIYPDSISHRYNSEIPRILYQILDEYIKFVQKFYFDDLNFKKCIGLRLIFQVNLLETSCTFHPDSRWNKEQVLEITDGYLNNELVNKYLSCCKMRDFSGWTMKVRFWLLKRKNYNLYYALCKRIKYRNCG